MFERKIAKFVVFLYCLNFCLDFFVLLQTIARVSHLIGPISPCRLLLSRSVFIKGESNYALRVSQSTADWGSERVGDNVLCGIFFLCMLREFMCGGGGVILEESVFCPGIHVGLPWVNPPCMCVHLQIVWVRALLQSPVSIKEAFEWVSKTTNTVARHVRCSQTGGN